MLPTDVTASLGIVALVFCAFTVSASVGLGGSLLMVPTLVLATGPKRGVALAALLLACNNVFKVVAYRRTLPLRATALVIVLVAAGAAFGAGVLIRVSDAAVGIGVLTAFAATLVFERRELAALSRSSSPLLAFGAGATSGFSGTSGPLKGVAIRNLGLDRIHFAGAASMASLAGDTTKSLVFADAELLDDVRVEILVLALPLMLAGTTLGRMINSHSTELRFQQIFWMVMAGYSVRLITIAF